MVMDTLRKPGVVERDSFFGVLGTGANHHIQDHFRFECFEQVEYVRVTHAFLPFQSSELLFLHGCGFRQTSLHNAARWSGAHKFHAWFQIAVADQAMKKTAQRS
jgi:hypothetical protein